MDLIQGVGVNRWPFWTEEETGRDGSDNSRQVWHREGHDQRDRTQQGEPSQYLGDGVTVQELVGNQLTEEPCDVAVDHESRCSGIRNVRVQPQSQTNGEGPNSGLHTGVDELAQNPLHVPLVVEEVVEGFPKLWLGFSRTSRQRLGPWHLSNSQDNEDNDQDDQDVLVWPQGQLQQLLVVNLCLSLRHLGNLVGNVTTLTEDQVLTKDNPHDVPKWDQHVSHVQALVGRSLGTEHRGISVTTGFQETQTDRNGEDGRQEHAVSGHV